MVMVKSNVQKTAADQKILKRRKRKRRIDRMAKIWQASSEGQLSVASTKNDRDVLHAVEQAYEEAHQFLANALVDFVEQNSPSLNDAQRAKIWELVDTCDDWGGEMIAMIFSMFFRWDGEAPVQVRPADKCLTYGNSTLHHRQRSFAIGE